jgi:5'-3' exonuclease
MGIKNFHTFLRRKIPSVYQTISIESLKNKKLSIDTSIFLCKFKNTYGNRWLNGFYQFICFLVSKEIQFVFVLDTKPPPEKSNERELRSQSREKNKERIEMLIDQWGAYKNLQGNKFEFEINNLENDFPELYNFLTKKHQDKLITQQIVENYLAKLQKNIIKITSADFDLLKKLFELMNVDFYYADSEAEGTCSLMNRKGLVDGVLTEDTDVMAYGTPVMYHNLSFKNNTVQKLVLQDVLTGLSVTFDQLRDFCILCGTDYNNNLEKIGPVRSMELIKKHNDLETISQTIDTSSINFVRIRDLFNSEQFELKIDSLRESHEIKLITKELQDFCFYNNIYISKEKQDLFFSSENFF